MALVACPECNSQISDSAQICPKCGVACAGSRKAFQESRRSSNVKVLKIIGIVFGGIFALGLLGAISEDFDAPKEVLAEKDDQQVLAVDWLKDGSYLVKTFGDRAYVLTDSPSMTHGDFERFYPKVCKAVVAMPERWRVITEVRIVNKHRYSCWGLAAPEGESVVKVCTEILAADSVVKQDSSVSLRDETVLDYSFSCTSEENRSLLSVESDKNWVQTMVSPVE